MENDGRVPDEWRPCPGFERHYLVSDSGHVRNRYTGKLLVGERDRDGYRKVNLSVGGVKAKRRVHRLVCEAFHGPCPDGYECAHLDGKPRNNAASNLAWVSRSENTRHQLGHGTYSQNGKRGEEHPRAKLSLADVAAMRSEHEAGSTFTEIARKHGVHRTTARKAILHLSWETANV